MPKLLTVFTNIKYQSGNPEAENEKKKKAEEDLLSLGKVQEKKKKQAQMKQLMRYVPYSFLSRTVPSIIL